MDLHPHFISSDQLGCVRSYLKKYLTENPIDDWLEKRAPFQYEPFYSSIDMRDAGYKLAPVDANLYPAGFNNVCQDDLRSSPEVVKPMVKRHFSNHLPPGSEPRLPKSIAILPETNTKNKFYADHLFELREIFRRLKIKCEIGWYDESVSSSFDLETSLGQKITVHPFRREENRLVFGPFDPEFILLNNDYSSGVPAFLDGIEQPIEPSYKMGWHSRKKSDFFKYYNELVADLANSAGIDPWQLQVDTKLVVDVDFNEGKGLDRVAEAVEEVIGRMKVEYEKRNIQEKPFVFVKNNAGTYGMGILRVESAQEILELNRREKNKMSVGKNHLEIDEVIVQEGIPTRYFVEGGYAEPVIYMAGHDVLGGFLRKNATRGKIDNLNSKGMVFQKLCISDLRKEANRDLELELVYGTIAQLSVSAISLEIAKVI